MSLAEETISTDPLLRPSQVEEMEQEIAAIDQQLAPPRTKLEMHIRAQAQIDRGELQQQQRQIRDMINKQAPKGFAADEIKGAVELEARMRDDIIREMPTQAEMRLNPAGAVEKHRAFETRNTTRIQRLKNLRLRLQMSGHEFGSMSSGDNVANLEVYRRKGADLDLNGPTQIDRKAFFVGDNVGGGGRNLMPPEEAAWVNAHAEKLTVALKIKDDRQRQLRLLELHAEETIHKAALATQEGGGAPA